MSNRQLASIEEVIEEARNGRMFILVDAEDRENEGDLVIPAQMATPDAVNFMAKHGRGLICLTLNAERAERLNLEYMAPRNQSRHQTAFTVSIEAREGISTGISAHDRARTISVAIDPTKDHRDIVSPGHVFPLVAREGGVLMRAGHTEAACDIARLAGLYPAGVICEIMNDDGSMARLPDLIPFAAEHGLKIGTINNLIAYRRKYDHPMRRTVETEVDTPFGPFGLKVYVNSLDNCEHLALVRGDLSAPGPALVRVHAVNVLEDVISGDVKAGHPVQRAMKMIAEEGRGAVVIVRDTWPNSITEVLGIGDGAGAGAADEDGEEDDRIVEIGIGSQILIDLGVTDMTLLTNSPARRFVGLKGYGLKVAGTRQIADLK